MNSSGRATVFIVVFLLLVIVAIGVGVALLVGQHRTTRRHLIPANYVGWVTTRYSVAEASPLPLEDGYLIYDYPPDGLLETSSERETGIALDEYYYKDGEDLLRLSANPLGSDGMIWHSYEGTATFMNDDGEEATVWTTGFFVGTREQYQERRGFHPVGAESLPRVLPPPPGSEVTE